MDDATIGARLRILRHWRGMTQAQLAGLAGIAPSYLSMIENGQRSLDRRSYISAVAAALRVSETDLVGTVPHMGADGQQSGPHALIPALRTALMTNSLARAAVSDARPAAELESEVRDIAGLFRSCDYIAIGQRLPGVLDELHLLAATGNGEDQRRIALAALIEACVTAAFTAKDLGYPDLAHIAAIRAEDAAAQLGDPLMEGKAAFLRFHTAPREMEGWDRAVAQAEDAAAILEPHAGTAPSACVLGLLTLSAALGAAVVQNEPAADHWLSQSAAIAARVPDDMTGNWQSFSATNVAIWRTTVAVERGEDGGKILELAAAVDERKLTAGSRRADYLADVGRGLARDPRTRTDAMHWLRRAEAAGPQRIRNSPAARETVAFLLQRSRAAAGGRELRAMASRMGVPH